MLWLLKLLHRLRRHRISLRLSLLKFNAKLGKDQRKSESESELNQRKSEFETEFNAKLGKDQRKSEFEPELHQRKSEFEPEFNAKLGRDQRQSEFEPELNVAAGAAKLGTDQIQSEFEPKLQAVDPDVKAEDAQTERSAVELEPAWRVAGPLCSLPRTYGDCRVPYGPMVFKKQITSSGVGTPFHVLTKKAEHQRATSC